MTGITHRPGRMVKILTILTALNDQLMLRGGLPKRSCQVIYCWKGFRLLFLWHDGNPVETDLVLLRQQVDMYRQAADALAQKPGHAAHRAALLAKSSRPLVKAFDESLLPPIRDNQPKPLPWPVLAATGFDSQARPTFTKYLDRLDGKTVTLTGFMQSTQDGLLVRAFFLLEYPVGCWFCEVPDPTGLVNVELCAGTTAELRRGLVKVTGVLELNRNNPESYLFSLRDARIGEVD